MHHALDEFSGGTSGRAGVCSVCGNTLRPGLARLIEALKVHKTGKCGSQRRGPRNIKSGNVLERCPPCPGQVR